MSWTLMKYDWRSLRKITLFAVVRAALAPLFLPAPFTSLEGQIPPHRLVFAVIPLLLAIAMATNTLVH